MKKLFAFLLVGGFCLALASCGGGSSSTSETTDSVKEEAPAMAPADSTMDSTMDADTTGAM